MIMVDYAYHTYCASLATLMSSALQMTGAKGLDWIGTSMVTFHNVVDNLRVELLESCLHHGTFLIIC